MTKKKQRWTKDQWERLNRLPARRAFIYYLRECLGLRYEDISGLVGLSKDTCGYIYRRVGEHLAAQELSDLRPSAWIYWQDTDKARPYEDRVLACDRAGHINIVRPAQVDLSHYAAFASLPRPPCFPSKKEGRMNGLVWRRIDDMEDVTDDLD